VADAWMPGAERVLTAADGGCLKGGVPRAVWMVVPGDPVRTTARESAESLVRLGRPCHLVWNPLTGDVAQLIPVTLAARGLGWPAAAHRGQPSQHSPGAGGRTADAAPHELACRPEPADPLAPAARDGLPGVNNEGRVCAQIGVIGPPGAPFTHGPVSRLHEIMNWLDSWRVPRVGPASRPPEAPGGRAPQRRRDWARGGHFGAAEVPGCTCGGSCAIDINRLTRTSRQLPATWPAAATPGRAGPGRPAPGGTSSGGGHPPGGPGEPFREPPRIPAMTRQPRRTPARSAAP
jgi:hypothetical protein